jgi:hypothetical protein
MQLLYYGCNLGLIHQGSAAAAAHGGAFATIFLCDSLSPAHSYL